VQRRIGIIAMPSWRERIAVTPKRKAGSAEMASQLWRLNDVGIGL